MTAFSPPLESIRYLAIALISGSIVSKYIPVGAGLLMLQIVIRSKKLDKYYDLCLHED